MKDFFGEFLAATPSPPRQNLGQTSLSTAAPPFKSHLVWMALSGSACAFVSWKVCSWYNKYKQLVAKAKKSESEKKSK